MKVHEASDLEQAGWSLVLSCFGRNEPHTENAKEDEYSLPVFQYVLNDRDKKTGQLGDGQEISLSEKNLVRFDSMKYINMMVISNGKTKPEPLMQTLGTLQQRMHLLMARGGNGGGVRAADIAAIGRQIVEIGEKAIMPGGVYGLHCSCFQRCVGFPFSLQ